jgi:hypothetical protein
MLHLSFRLREQVKEWPAAGFPTRRNIFHTADKKPNPNSRSTEAGSMHKKCQRPEREEFRM